MKNLFLLFAAMILIAGCAANKQSIINRVDPISVSDRGRLDRDAEECMKYAQVEADSCAKAAGINAGAGAVIGAGIGALTGLIIGHDTAGMTSGLGALYGAVSGVAATRCKMDMIVGNCMLTRGYRLLW